MNYVQAQDNLLAASRHFMNMDLPDMATQIDLVRTYVYQLSQREKMLRETLLNIFNVAESYMVYEDGSKFGDVMLDAAAALALHKEDA